MVPVEGIEPPLLAEHDFESCASTSSATRAQERAPRESANRRLYIVVTRPRPSRLATHSIARWARISPSPPRGERELACIALALARRTGKLPQSVAMRIANNYRWEQHA